ncbi:unannotated protein [freshwater metagenome]|uniref:Unannotated protein n=1 Tax=freshwater metagenome TaxID=449393 RepID=A0A6J7IL40_9ZZZZ
MTDVPPQTAVHPRKWWIVAVTAGVTSLGIVAAAGIFSASAWSSPHRDVTAGSAAVSALDVGLGPISQQAVVTDEQFQTEIDNIVFILADDLDWATFRQVPRLNALQAKGTTFTNTTVTDSLCCPSRVSILRGQYVHNHKVVSNEPASGGGWPTFYRLGEEKDCLPTWLSAKGVQTAFMGKYLNAYPDGAKNPAYVPPGWDRWVVPVTQPEMYRGYGYTLNIDGTLKTYGEKPKDFLGDVLVGQAAEYIGSAREPFYLQLSLTNPHRPSPVASRHLESNKTAVIPRTKGFNAAGQNEPAWRSALPPLSPRRLAALDKRWRERVQSSETVADAYDAVVAALTKAGKLNRTLIVIGSDNGYHSAVRRLPPGKRTPYLEDTVVPYVFIGPGVAAGAKVPSMTSTIDLGPTFAALLGTEAPQWTDGRSLVPFLARGVDEDWRTGVISESMSQARPGDPDYETLKPPRFTALRTEQWVYVEYEDGTKELYNRATDPDELDNVLPTADPELVKSLNRQLVALRACAGPTCRVADSLPN